MDKAFWKSKTLWGVLAMAIPGVGPIVSTAILALPAGGTTDAVAPVIATGDTSGMVAALLGVFAGLPPMTQVALIVAGAVWAVLGRVKPEWLKTVTAKVVDR